ncbi:MAG: hypothetical protein AAB150_15755 [Pseudomonadota bacterium]
MDRASTQELNHGIGRNPVSARLVRGRLVLGGGDPVKARGKVRYDMMTGKR